VGDGGFVREVELEYVVCVSDLLVFLLFFLSLFDYPVTRHLEENV
jgi:hypothetical protein